MFNALYCGAILLYLDHIQTHVNDMLSTSAVVSGSGIALEGITEVTTVQIMVPQVIMASPGKGSSVRGDVKKVNRIKNEGQFKSSKED